MKPKYWNQACQMLIEVEPFFSPLIEQYPPLSLGSRGDAFHTLARSIVGQQISVKAAQSVWLRLLAGFETFTPERVLERSIPQLRQYGLSEQKSKYISDLAKHFFNGQLNPEEWKQWEDEALIHCLTQVKGIGRWTAQMHMIFHMGRPDIFPVDDLGLKKAMVLHFARGRELRPHQMEQKGEKWKPWRTVATWYLWRSLELTT